MHGLGNYYGIGFSPLSPSWALIEQQKRRIQEEQAQQAQQAQPSPDQKKGFLSFLEQLKPPKVPAGPSTPETPVGPETPATPAGPATSEEPKKASIVPLLGIGGALLVGGAIATAFILKKRRQARARNYL